MAFEKKTWKARKTEYPNRRMLTLEDGSTELVTVAREEGIISEEGDAFSPENMNGLEDRIEKEFTALGKSVSDGKAKVAGAITAQGVSTAADATFDTMAANITAAGTARYNAGRTQGRKDVTSSPNTYNLYTKAQYDANYSKGVTAADNRANPNSVNYKTGYNAGYAAGQNAVKIIRKEVAKQVTCHTGGGEGSPRIELVTFDMDFPHGVVGLENYWVDGQGQKFGIHGFDISRNRITLHLGNTISWFDATITLRAMIVGY